MTKMTDSMSTPYLLTLVSERIDELKGLIYKLENQDSECSYWSDIHVDKICNMLSLVKDISHKRISEVLKEQGKNPEDYSI